MNIRNNSFSLYSLHTSKGHIFTDFGNVVGERIGYCLSIDRGTRQFVRIGYTQRSSSYSFYHFLKIRIFGNKVCFGVYFNCNTFSVACSNRDKSLCCHSTRFFCRFSQSFGSKPINCSLKISICFSQSFFSVHHACASCFPQFLYHRSRYCHDTSYPILISLINNH